MRRKGLTRIELMTICLLLLIIVLSGVHISLRGRMKQNVEHAVMGKVVDKGMVEVDGRYAWYVNVETFPDVPSAFKPNVLHRFSNRNDYERGKRDADTIQLGLLEKKSYLFRVVGPLNTECGEFNILTVTGPVTNKP